MSRLRHEKGLPRLAGAGSGVHRLEKGKPLSFKHDEELKGGGKVHRVQGGACGKLARKRGGACHSKGGKIVGQDGKPSHHGTDAIPHSGTKLGTHVQEVKMSSPGHIEDSLKDGGKIRWLHHAHGGKLSYQERKHLKSSNFVFPGERKYPIEDEAHGRNALARVSQHGSPAEKAKVRAAVHRKYPGIGKKHKD